MSDSQLYLNNTLSDKAFKGTVVNQTCQYINGGSLKLTFTVLYVSFSLFSLLSVFSFLLVELLRCIWLYQSQVSRCGVELECIRGFTRFTPGYIREQEEGGGQGIISLVSFYPQYRVALGQVYLLLSTEEQQESYPLNSEVELI